LTNLHKYSVLVFCLVVGLAACQSSAIPSATSLPAPTQVASAIPTATAPAATAQPLTTSPVPGNLKNGALRLEFNGQNTGFSLNLVDTTNGAAVAGFPPLDFAGLGTYMYLPGGTEVALVSYPRVDNPANASLVLFDVPAWKTNKTVLPMLGWAQLLAVDKDGRHLAVAGSGTKHNLVLIDLATMSVVAQADVPNYVRALSFSQDGSSLMVYVSNEDSQTGLSAGAPQALLLKASDLSTLWQAALPGVRDGFAPGENYQGDPYSPGSGTRYSPAVVFSPVSNMLYVVHGDENRLTSVDFTKHRISALDIHPHLGFLEQLLSFGAGVVQAKEQSGTEKNAAISADGSQLYVAGESRLFSPNPGGGWKLDQSSLGLQVISPASGEELQSLDTKSDQIALLPDGRILLRSVYGDTPSSQIFDPASGKMVQEYADLYQECVPLVSGGYVLASSLFYGNPGRVPPVQVFDARTGQLIGSWKAEDPNSQWLGCSP
jgi:DNA-binding beta-propeller fold protein YncE